MADKGVETKPSSTALMTALRRALACLEYGGEPFGPDHLAVYFLPAHYRFFLKVERVRANTRRKLSALFPGMTEYLIARTAHFDRLYKKALTEGIPQIVLLGAGYDSRTCRFAALNQSTRVFEVDSVPTQTRKLKCLRSAGIAIPPQVSFVPIDFNRESPGEALERAGYQKGETTLFLWEGVSYYLDRKSVDEMLELVSQAAQESRIGFDYAIPVKPDALDEIYGAREFAASMRQYHRGEELRFSLDEEEIGSFLEQRHLSLVEHYDADEIERAYLMKGDGTSLGRITGVFRFAVASPAA